MFLLHLLTLFAVAYSLDWDLETTATEYLWRYGYISDNGRSPYTIGNFEKGLKDFQKFFHLLPTGKLDKETLNAMITPRCGNRDVRERGQRHRRFVASSYYWHKRSLTYKFDNFNSKLGKENLQRIFKAAFVPWSQVTGLNFTEVLNGDSDFTIGFYSGKHAYCYDQFDGKGNTYAHAFVPEDGRIHFDADDDFTDGIPTGVNLLQAATHEIGHALGLFHSEIRESVMFPTYKDYKNTMVVELHQDDIGAIRTLYGCPPTSKQPSFPEDLDASYRGAISEEWYNVPGKAVGDITSKICAFPHQADKMSIVESMVITNSSQRNVGYRLRAYYTAGTDEYQHFSLCGSYSAHLYFSSDHHPRNKKLISKVDSPKGNLFCSCEKSKEIFLQKGQTYYLEAIAKAENGPVNLSVGIEKTNSINVIKSPDISWFLPNVEIKTLVCFGRYERLYCPFPYLIDITEASFGQGRKFDLYLDQCNVDDSSRLFKECWTPNALSIVREKCQAKVSCDLYASPKVFGTECSRTMYGVLGATYKCVAPCLSSPCQNNGQCTTVPGEGYKCICRSGTSGRHCENQIDECKSLPCQNGGICVDVDFGFNCTCPKGFSGKLCEIENCRDSEEEDICQQWKSRGACNIPALKTICMKTCGC